MGRYQDSWEATTYILDGTDVTITEWIKSYAVEKFGEKWENDWWFAYSADHDVGSMLVRVEVRFERCCG